MDVSIIMPSFNRFPLNINSLIALENQTFDLSRMEVILIDDASTDETSSLTYYQPAYHFKYIRNSRNIGLASSRNKGLKIANGRVIMFLDAEMIVDPNYVQTHFEHHQKNDKLVVIGGNKRAKLFSVLYPGFDSAQMKVLSNLVSKEPFVKKTIQDRTKKKVSSRNLKSIIKNLKYPIPLIKEENLKSFSNFNSLSIPSKRTNKLLLQLGNKLEKSPLSWLACVGNLSINKQFFEKVGGYDEDFKGWGTEDHEFAYRLYLNGAKFVIDDSLVRYHQEHPKPANRNIQGRKNRVLFQKKHPVLDVCIRSLKSIHKEDYMFMHNVLVENNLLQEKYPGKYIEFNNSLIAMLQRAAILHSKDKSIRKLLRGSDFSNIKKHKKLMLQRKAIESHGKYKNLVHLFDLLNKQ